MDNDSLAAAGKSGKPTPKGELLRFLKSVVSDPPAHCVTWPFGRDGSGYGQLRFAGGKIGAHRLAWELYNGRVIAAGNHAAHAPKVCHNRLCVNPRHIREATPTENVADRVEDGTANRGERQGHSKLTEADVIAIRADPRLLREVSADYGVCDVTISDIKNRRTWSWL